MKRMTLSTSPAVAVAGLLACFVCLAPRPAHAGIYGWVDSSGHVTYSNLPPPKGAKVIDTIEDEPVDPAAVARAAAAHDAQMQALNERVRQLEYQLQQSQRAAAPPPTYAVAPPPQASGCDGYFNDCLSWEGPIYYSIGIPVGWPRYYRPYGRIHGPHHLAQNTVHAPGRTGAGTRR
jgi:uncharacterized coiled-coil protein SlyX